MRVLEAYTDWYVKRNRFIRMLLIPFSLIIVIVMVIAFMVDAVRYIFGDPR